MQSAAYPFATPLPLLFVKRLQAILPTASLEDSLQSFSCSRPTSFRVNTLKTTEPAVVTALRAEGFSLRRIEWRSGTYCVPPDQRRALTESRLFGEGLIYVQDLSSMLAPMVLAPKPGERVLDLAAAPGGKTLQMAAMMENRGELSAVESVRGRFFRLKANLKRGGATMVSTYLKDGRSVGAKVPDRFDRVLLDAPCASEARFDANDPESWSHWNLKKVQESARKQRRLLDSAIRSLRPGGTLVYCTCSFSPEENEQAVDSQLRRYGDAVAVTPIELPLSNVQPGLLQWGRHSYNEQLRHAVRVL
ncbi:MAG TPA: RsmB/NOP family class I SAM-dependent RNA methyltransferase, partial [Gammaproteobacteria bacterium]|nr:RsmB/NOP family class I SAM-dependent RNA methyltransferase [Gammaproteobacteria bacterium]